MKTYLEYKKSKHDFLNKIPKKWNEMKLKYIAKTRVSNVDKKSEDEIGIRLCNYVDVYNNEIISDELNFMYATATKAQIELFSLRKGDVILTKDSETPKDIGIPAYVNIKNSNNLVCGYHLAICTPQKNILVAKYLFRLFQSNIFKSYFEVNSKGVTRYGLDTYSILNTIIPLPSIKEQFDISIYLDRKVNNINDLIIKRVKLIKLLKEKSTRLIFDYVTKGIKNELKYTKTEYDWLVIPSHWKQIRAKNIFYESKDRSNGDEELLSVSHYSGVTPRSTKKVNMFLAESYEGYKLCKKNDLVINIMWAWMGALGISDYDGIVSAGYGVYRLKKSHLFYPKYLDYLLRSPGYIGEYTKRSKGVHSSRWRMYSDDFFQIKIICPPLKEQIEIVDKIEFKLNAINSMITIIEKELALFKEYKEVLISEVVSGKLDVRT